MLRRGFGAMPFSYCRSPHAEIFRHIHIDLRWLICDQALSTLEEEAMNQIEWIKLILEFIERNQVITAFIISMCIVGFALYVVLRAILRA